MESQRIIQRNTNNINLRDYDYFTKLKKPSKKTKFYI